MRTNCRTYELFEIARLILDKAERFVVVMHPKPGEGPQEFFISVPDGLPFSSEDQVLAHVLKNHLDKFVDAVETEVEPPTGNFPTVNRCGVTGTLLGPPNYHRYQALVVEHHSMNVPNMPFEKFTSRIESVRDEEVVKEWIEKMRKETRYKLKQPDGVVEGFDTMESLKFYLVNKRRAEIVRTTNQARFSGKQAESLPRGLLRDSIFGWLEQQQRFPLETANNLRGRLRRMHFTIYKRGSKGASYVCAVKRKFRNPQTRLAESLQDLIDFIEKHPNIEVSSLPEQFLGIDIKAKALPEPSQEKAPDIESVSEEEAAKIVEAHEQKRAAREAGEASADAEPATEQTASEPKASEPEAAVVEATPIPAPAKPEVSQLEDPGLRQMMFDLRWLVTEGYVTEYGDGRLFAPAPMEEQAPAAKKQEVPEKKHSSDEAVNTKTEAPATETPATETPAAEKPVTEAPAAELKPVASEEEPAKAESVAEAAKKPEAEPESVSTDESEESERKASSH
ncbi:hypothetical protein GCM10007047_34130 [Cerasicoccus arenae]|uniref:Uncharacterized protein n=2 Tax=Cerasicoccus arenae TaxID=424488 RepID=A0A8J3GF27_9BACT|nr:hypothetical protein GCM10007047_34130 [Cerasicoccus arenae]